MLLQRARHQNRVVKVFKITVSPLGSRLHGEDKDGSPLPDVNACLASGDDRKDCRERFERGVVLAVLV